MVRPILAWAVVLRADMEPWGPTGAAARLDGRLADLARGAEGGGVATWSGMSTTAVPSTAARGSRSGSMTWEVPGGQRIEHHELRFPRASVTAVVVDGDRVLLLWRHRFITNAWGWEVPAGWADPGEDPEDAVRREIEEETGWRAATVTPMTSYNGGVLVTAGVSSGWKSSPQTPQVIGPAPGRGSRRHGSCVRRRGQHTGPLSWTYACQLCHLSDKMQHCAVDGWM